MNRPLAFAVALLLTPVVGLALARLHGTVSLDVALQLFSSGDEAASLFAVWKAVNGLDVYADRFQRPYNAVFFNWLFYQSYGMVVAEVRSALSLADDWLPTIGRLFTLCAMGVAATIFYRLGRWLQVGRPWPVVAVLAVFCGPLFGFWPVTVRPDVWAMACELAGLAWLCRRWSARPIGALLGFALFVWLAWSFKQAAITSLVGVGLFLLVRRRFADLAVLVAVMVALFGGTLWMGGAQYRASVLFADIPLRFAVSSMLFTMGLGLAKGAPVWGGAAGALFALVRSRQLARAWADDILVILACCTFSGLGLAFLASFQDGAAENYLFVPTVSAALLVLRATVFGPLSGWRPMVVPALAGLAATAVFAGMSLVGRGGMTDLRQQHVAFTAMRECLKPLTRPFYVANQYLSLPWITPGNEPFVLSFVYDRDRQRGRTFADGGIGGLVAAGYFTAVVLPGTTEAVQVDGASLDGYVRRPETCADMGIWDRRVSP